MKAMMASVALTMTVLAVPIPVLAQQEAPAPIPQAQLDAARPVVARLFPEGSYRRLMGGTMRKMMDGMIGTALETPTADFARMSGVPLEQVQSMKPASVGRAMAILDPHFRERTKLGMNAMMDAMTDMLSDYEPKVREAMTRAYARKFTPVQLAEMNAFFSTPTGSYFASENMALASDPEILAAAQGLMPEMMKRMPDFAKLMEEKTAQLPARRQLADLSPEEREQLADLIGVKASDLGKSGGE